MTVVKSSELAIFNDIYHFMRICCTVSWDRWICTEMLFQESEIEVDVMLI